MSNGFKLIAIRPLVGCAEKFSKVLRLGHIYKFYDYTFIRDNENDIHSSVINVVPNNIEGEDLYNIDGTSINISALVGKNGVGKSSLIELLFIATYLIGVKTNKLDNLDDCISKRQALKLQYDDWKQEITEKGLELDVKKEQKQLNEIERFTRLIADIEDFEKNFKIELFYSIDDSIFCLVIDNNRLDNIPIVSKDISQDRYYKILHLFANIEGKEDVLKLNDFFYNIALNYSAYGLNSETIGVWIEELFHKNDGYQTPMVINPMRTSGGFDINIETHLCQTRILLNLLDQSMKVKRLLKAKEVKAIIFTCDENKVKDVDRSYDNKLVSLYNADLKEKVFNKIYKSITGEKFSNEKIIHIDLLKLYIFKKVLKITRTYDDYRDYEISPKEAYSTQESRRFIKLLWKLKDDSSHITTKLRQAINIVRYDILREDKTKGIKWENNNLKLTLNELTKRLNSNEDRERMMPVAFYNPNIIFEDSDFKFLSSGEQQLINALQTVYYHLINLNSVTEKDIADRTSIQDKTVTYKNVNIVFDEVELYFHPEFQQNFVSELISGLKQLDIPRISNLNILFSTHSPFVLSDILVTQCLFLEIGNDGKADSKSYKYLGDLKTFGANIHDMLRHAFFMSSGHIGEFAREKIDKIVNLLYEAMSGNEEKKKSAKEAKNAIENTIELIGDEMVRGKLLKMLYHITAKNHKEALRKYYANKLRELDD
ncbi:AAA family ATPase [Carboxylicivirga sediminis]|nr:hypothetical protein [Carboxylicivirga sediminis]